MPVRTEQHGAVRHVVLSRPEKRNAVDEPTMEQFAAAMADVAIDDDVRCIVVRGDGDHFCAGLDLELIGELRRDPSRLAEVRGAMLAAWNTCEEIAKPTVCVVHGAAIGGGLELALACDLRVAAANARLGLAEARYGLIPDVGGSSRLASVIGLGRAKELIMTAALVDGVEAERIGLVNRVAPRDDLDAACAALVDALLACGTAAAGHAKRIIDAAAKPALEATLQAEIEAQATLLESPEFAARTAGVA
jgi:enoyl-CoA hydratase/carnithine racemase